MEVNPLSIILVKSDSKGDRLLFRYPIVVTNSESNQKKKRHPYSLITQEDILQSPLPQTSNIHQGTSFSLCKQEPSCQQILLQQVNCLGLQTKYFQRFLLLNQNYATRNSSWR